MDGPPCPTHNYHFHIHEPIMCIIFVYNYDFLVLRPFNLILTQCCPRYLSELMRPTTGTDHAVLVATTTLYTSISTNIDNRGYNDTRLWVSWSAPEMSESLTCSAPEIGEHRHVVSQTQQRNSQVWYIPISCVTPDLLEVQDAKSCHNHGMSPSTCACWTRDGTSEDAGTLQQACLEQNLNCQYCGDCLHQHPQRYFGSLALGAVPLQFREGCLRVCRAVVMVRLHWYDTMYGLPRDACAQLSDDFCHQHHHRHVSPFLNLSGHHLQMC
jgi:hypothetical protein